MLVVKGGTGLRTVGFSSTASTVQALVRTDSANALASLSLSSRTALPAFSPPVLSSKSLPVAIRWPPTWVSLASKPLPD